MSWASRKARFNSRRYWAKSARAGIEKDVTPHVLRHTFASRFLRKGNDLASLRKMLGHSNIVTTSRYLHPDAERLQEMVEEL